VAEVTRAATRRSQRRWPVQSRRCRPATTRIAGASLTSCDPFPHYEFWADSLFRVTRPPPDPARGAEAARKLKCLGAKRILIKAAELVTSRSDVWMPECFCPQELAVRGTSNPSRPNCPTGCRPSSISQSQSEKGAVRVSTTLSLAHRLCNRIDYSISAGRAHKKDLERIRIAHEATAGS